MADQPIEAFLRQRPGPGQPVADDNFDPYRRPVFQPSVNCADCHPKKKDSDFKLSDFNDFNRSNSGLDLLKRGRPGEDAALAAALFKPLTPEQQQAAEKREVERFEKEDPIEKTIHVLSRMPDKLSVKFTGNKLSVQTDFARLVESVPGVKLDDTSSKILSGVKELSLAADKFTLDLKQNQSFPINRDIPLLGKVQDLGIGDGKQQVRFDVDFDKNADRVTLKNIEGITLNIAGSKSLKIHEVSLDNSGKIPILNVSIDNPKECPSVMKGTAMEKNWPKTLTIPLPLESIVPGMNAGFVKGLVRTLSDAKVALQNKDASMFLSGIADEGMRGKLDGMLKGITSISKDGDKFEICRDNGFSKHDFGGPELQVSPRISFSVGQSVDSPYIKNIEGITFSAPLPAQLGIGDKLIMGLKEINLGPKSEHGRTLTVRTDNVLDKVTVALDANMKPRTDADGNWSADIVVKNPIAAQGNNDRLGFNLRFDKNGQPNMPTSEMLDIASRATAQGAEFSPAGVGMAIISQATGAASDVVRVYEWVRGWFD